ncbi:Uma2 family endonuclease [Iningainema tapete]|uniref:Uma2 family endonuclease n=1 Tax=Iningainema tapete BLCC-T55 TaxID=2748662 RepID=A0A8J6XFP3_9CYAN|nr:Uma2 family endonuclease [Iningainema tapete]MBD2772180.1 Uma2 family endonuclease [Iningainema tapete BLCC-T55]
MFALISREKIQLPPGTVVRMPGSWLDYQELCSSRGDSAIPRIKYSSGEILLMSPLPKHGRDAHLVANIVTTLLDCQNRNYEAFTPITMDLPEFGGIEPDYCFYIDNWQAVVGRDRLKWGTDSSPDLVIEIDVTTYTNASDYLPYRVPEVWLLKRNQLAIYRLQENEYQQQTTSRYFPAIDLQTIVAQCLEAASERGTGVAIRELRQRLSNDAG